MIVLYDGEMIRRDRQNIGKPWPIAGHKDFNGRRGRVEGLQAMRKSNRPISGGKWCL